MLVCSEFECVKWLFEQQVIFIEIVEQCCVVVDQFGVVVQVVQVVLDVVCFNFEFIKVWVLIDGCVGCVMVIVGNFVIVGDSVSVLIMLVLLDIVFVYFDVDESIFLCYVQMVCKGECLSECDSVLLVKVGLFGEEGYLYMGKVDFFDNQVVCSIGIICVCVLLDNVDCQFMLGLFVCVQLFGSGQFQVMLIDDKVVLIDQDCKYVYVVDKDGKVQCCDIQFGCIVDGLCIVEYGLVVGDKVIIDGVQKVFMLGMLVQVKVVVMQLQLVLVLGCDVIVVLKY